jgi:hypothetical protein
MGRDLKMGGGCELEITLPPPCLFYVMRSLKHGLMGLWFCENDSYLLSYSMLLSMFSIDLT